MDTPDAIVVTFDERGGPDVILARNGTPSHGGISITTNPANTQFAIKGPTSLSR